MPITVRARAAALAALTLTLPLALGACAPKEQSSSSGGSKQANCTPGKLPTYAEGRLTIGTDSPAYPPWFVDNKPTNGKGYESAVAYAVADELGYPRSKVTWTKVPFNTSYAPGPKKFDFDINQISVTPAREKAVDFSSGYYSAAQALVALKGSKGAAATSRADLAKLKLGAQTGTTSLTVIREEIKPSAQPQVYEDTNVAKQQLQNHQVDGIVVDLPTAFYITAAEIPGSTIVGQFRPQRSAPEQFGMLLQKDSELTVCVDKAVAELKSDGTLKRLEKKWLSDVVSVPELK